ncbi:protein-glutamate methylesterase/protein-glutamine glutaminase [Paenibacillus turpanensis]|uniref:protein-glutamate methylesterase/protein-glutamine glutaminase n=1 Tax=Paenibacillus turpanensis TaxID=2689078 RepID=UPI00140BE596|nr:chemotaxis response regulator protein-glutamate methylesterase [Paenibacillus turpanensis]
MRKIKVLVVDDSLVFREVLSRGLMLDSNIEVVAKAVDPYDARDKILEFEPDVMTCDIEMPKMNGIEFIRRLLPQYSIPVIVISTISNAVFDALNAGAVDFLVKPDIRTPQSIEDFIRELISKVKTAAKANVLQQRTASSQPSVVTSGGGEASDQRLIAIGASTGGTEAIYSLLKALPPEMPGIVIVQHIPPVFSRMFAERLNQFTPFQVREASSGLYVQRGHVYIAPGDQHMKVKKLGGRYKLECFQGAKVNGHCPSVDVLFDSVAKEAGADGFGLILTGMGYDGAKGLMSMRRRGARTLGQNEASSVVYGMPKAAFELGAVEKQVPLEQMARVLCGML